MFLSLLKNTFFAFVAYQFSLTTQFKLKDSRAFVVGKIYEPLQNFHHHHRCHFHHNDMLAELWSTSAKCNTLSIFYLIIITRNHFCNRHCDHELHWLQQDKEPQSMHHSNSTQSTKANQSSCLESVVNRKNCQRIANKKAKKRQDLQQQKQYNSVDQREPFQLP